MTDADKLVTAALVLVTQHPGLAIGGILLLAVLLARRSK